MSDVMLGNRLDRLVDEGRPHPGPANAAIALVEYCSYACPYCRAANERIAKCAISSATGCAISSFIGLSSASSSLLRRRTGGADRGPQKFCDAHVKLMTRSETLTEDDVNAVARDLGVSADCSPSDNPAGRCGQSQRRGEPRDRHAHLLYQWPPL